MAARTLSELANWDGRLDQQRQNATWSRASSSLARDPYHTPQPIEVFQPPARFSDQKRAEQSAFRSNLERDSFANSSANARLPSRVDTTSTPSHDTHHYRQASITHTAPNSALPSSPFLASPKSANSSAHASRVHTSRLPSSREHNALPQPAPTIESEVIDLTMEDTEDEASVSNMLVPRSAHSNGQFADPGPSHRPLSSGRSSPIAPEQSLFTPPPPSRRPTRLLIDYLAVPPFPKRLTKADYQAMSDRSTVPLPSPTVASTLRDSPLTGSSVTKAHPSPQKRKGKEREHDVVSSRKKHKQRSSVNGADVDPSAFLDAFYEHATIPLQDVDTYPPLTTLDLAINSRFQFAHAWRGHASRLRETEPDWMFKLRLPCSSPRIPGTTGYVSSEQLRSWELVLPESSPQEKSTKHDSDEQADATKSHADVELAANYLSLPDDASPVPSAAFDPALSSPTVFQDLTVVDMEHDMNQYFNGLSDSPAKHVPPRQQLSPTHTFRPHLFQSVGHAQTNSLELGFPSLESDHRLADRGDHEYFLGVPPSPTPAGTEPSAARMPITDSPFEPVNYFTASPSCIFGASPTDAWSFEQGESLLPDNDSLPSNHVTPSALGTIDPSLLGPEQSQTPSQAPKDTTPRRRSKLPEPVIYIRRPIDSSRLPVVSGKRPVQIKYRDSGDSPATPSIQTGSNEAPSNLVENPVALSTNGTESSPQAKRHSAPSRKLREYHTAFESDSDYIPETSTSKIEIKLKRPIVKPRNKELDVEQRGIEAETVPTMSFCHQCRNKSARPKMLCSNVIQDRVCGKRFCNRCILYRYPDITFDEHSAGFLCPACTNTCNCSFCSRSRGEEFISMRLGGLAASLFKTKVTLVRDIGKPLHRAKAPPKPVDARRSASAATTPTPEPGALPQPSRFWAHVYGMEGERVGSAFMTREHMERLQTGGRAPAPPPPRPQQPPRKARKPAKRDEEREKTRSGPRVFVGRPLASWKVRAVRDLEPSAGVETAWERETGGGGGKGKERESTRRRCYVGDLAPLYEPYGRMPGTASLTPSSSRCSSPVLDSDGSLTPLSALEAEAEYWPQPEVGECCSWAPPPPPGAIVHAPMGTGSPDAVGMGSGSSVEADMDVGDEQGSASTGLSKEDLARAIGAAFAALSVKPPC